METNSIATSVVTILAPYMPFLIETGKEGVKKITERFAEKGADSAWGKAQEIWNRINAHFSNDTKIKGAALMVSAEPADETSKRILIDVLIERLRANPQLARELLELIGRHEPVQVINADKKSKVSDVTQENSKGGRQSIEASHNSQIEGIKQVIK